MSIFTDDDNTFKGGVHGVELAIAVLLCSYNWLVWKSDRGQPHHLVSASVYGSLVAFETVQVTRHLRKS